MSDLSIDAKLVGEGAVIIYIKGFLDANTFDEFDESLNRLFENNVSKIAVDFSELDYISSAGAGVLIGSSSMARESGGEIVLINPVGEVKEVFDLLGITRLFRIAIDAEDALRYLGVSQ